MKFKYIANIAKIEEEIKELDTQQKLSVRTEKVKPILTELREYLIGKQPHILPKSPLGVAVNYTLNQLPKLLTHLNDGRLENNNNRAERAIKPFVIGRKGWLFSGSVAGANAAAKCILSNNTKPAISSDTFIKKAFSSEFSK